MSVVEQQAEQERLSRVFAALADPSRRAILSRLAHGSVTVGELAAPLPISKPAVSQHLKVLESAGLIERSVKAQWRSCELRAESLDEVSEWIVRHRRIWDQRFDRLDEHLGSQVERTEDG